MTASETNPVLDSHAITCKVVAEKLDDAARSIVRMAMDDETYKLFRESTCLQPLAEVVRVAKIIAEASESQLAASRRLLNMLGVYGEE